MRIRFSLRTLFLIQTLVVVAIFVCWHRWWQPRRAIELLQKRGISISETGKALRLHGAVVKADDMALLAGLPVSFLSLFQCSIERDAVKYLHKLKQLRELQLIETPVGPAGLAELAQLLHLDELGFDATGCDVEQVGRVVGRHSLRHLRLNRLEGERFSLDNLQQLEQLDIEESRVTELSLRNLPRLSKFSFSWVMNDAVQKVKITELPALTTLSVDSKLLDELVLKNVPRLEWLYVGYGHVQFTVDELPSLKELTFQPQSADGSYDGVPEMPNLEEFSGAVTDGFLARLVRSPNLRRLEIYDGTFWGPLTAAGFRQLGECQTLEILKIDDERFGDAAVPALLKLKKLRILSLSGDGLSDASIPLLEKMTHLKSLDVSWSGITPAGKDRLQASLPQTEVKQHELPVQ